MTVRTNRAAMDKMLASASAKAVTKVAIEVETTAKRMAPVDTGQLRASITHEPGVDSRGFYVRVGSHLRHALYTEFGTGLFNTRPGALRKRIEPATGKVLAFRVHGDKVFARSIAGARPHPWLRPALKAVALKKRQVR